ncbi:MAG: anthranilate synthase component II [Nitrospinota bacterium]
MILVIDNYDSFTYNLVHYFLELGVALKVARNDKIDIDEIESLSLTHIVLSPGPKRPSDAGVTTKVVRAFNGKIPILGICLGHQSIAAAYGGKIIRSPELMHGKSSKILHDNEGIFRDIPPSFSATRYHSLIVDQESLPERFKISATVANGLIMGIRDKNGMTEGLQFHPESIISEYGKKLLSNFLRL